MSTDWAIYERDSPRQVHVLPIQDSREHELRDGCICLPSFQQSPQGVALYVHHSFDGRVTEDAEQVM